MRSISELATSSTSELITNSVNSFTSSSSSETVYMNYALISALVAFALAQSIKVFTTRFVFFLSVSLLLSLQLSFWIMIYFYI